jgi:hypothetical protein
MTRPEANPSALPTLSAPSTAVDLPRNSRDIQDFLTLNPNIVGGGM